MSVCLFSDAVLFCNSISAVRTQHEMQSMLAPSAQRPICFRSTRPAPCVCQMKTRADVCEPDVGHARSSEHRDIKQQLAVATANILLTGSLLLGCPQSAIANEVKLDANPIYGEDVTGSLVLHTCTGTITPLIISDGATILKPEVRDSLTSSLKELDRQTGFHVRVFTQYQIDQSADKPNPRQLWGSLDNKTVVVWADPSSPNILSVPFVGDDVLAKLRRPFWTEIESRFGNMFFVREQGDSVALQSALSAVIECLGREEGCRVVPGLPREQYIATLACSIAGGLVAGFVSKIEPQGFVQRRWVWLLLFSPLWASLFINFGLGPVVSRTSDLAPIAGNVLGFLVAAVTPGVLQRLWDGDSGEQGPGSVQNTRDGI